MKKSLLILLVLALILNFQVLTNKPQKAYSAASSPPNAGVNYRIGETEVSSGAYVILGEKEWRVIGANFLLLAQNESQLRPFDDRYFYDSHLYPPSTLWNYLITTFYNSGNYIVYAVSTLFNPWSHTSTVNDDKGGTDTKSLSFIFYNNSPIVNITQPTNEQWLNLGAKK